MSEKEISFSEHLTPEDALVALMVAVAVSDENVKTSELISIARVVDHLPIFGAYNAERVTEVSKVVYDLMAEEEGLDALFGMVKTALPDYLNETAYALACDVAAADGRLMQTELLLLETLRHELDIDRLHGAAIERGARARHMRML